MARLKDVPVQGRAAGPKVSTKVRSVRLKAFRRWLDTPATVVGLTVLLVLLLAGLLAPFLTPYGPATIAIRERLLPPGSEHLLGTDHLGRDIATRMLFGARLSVAVGTLVVIFSSAIGIAMGLLGGYNRRFGDLVMRMIDGIMAFPGLVFALALIAALGSSFFNVVLALSFVYVPRIARVVHASVLSLRNEEYVVAAEALGGREARVLLRHILPNTLGPVVVQSTFIFAYAVIAEASLSFLGVGLPPGTASWGVILSEGRNYMLGAPWITLFPGIAIFVLVLGLNLLGDTLRDILDPKVT